MPHPVLAKPQAACGAHMKRRSNLPVWWLERHGAGVNRKNPGAGGEQALLYNTQIQFDSVFLDCFGLGLLLMSVF